MPTDHEILSRIISERRSVRRFLPDAIEPDKLAALIEAARWAPSAGNRQAWRFLVVTSPDKIQQLRVAVEAAVGAIEGNLRRVAQADAREYLKNFTHFAEAPALVVPIHRAGPELIQALQEGAPGGPPRAVADALCSVSAAIQNLLLTAPTLGLGACWMTGPLIAADALAELLGLQSGWSVSALIPVGIPAEEPEPPTRRTLDRLIQRFE